MRRHARGRRRARAGGRSRPARPAPHRSRTRSARRGRGGVARLAEPLEHVPDPQARNVDQRDAPQPACPTSAIVPPPTVSMLLGPAGVSTCRRSPPDARSSTTMLDSSSAVANASGRPRGARRAGERGPPRERAAGGELEERATMHAPVTSERARQVRAARAGTRGPPRRAPSRPPARIDSETHSRICPRPPRTARRPAATSSAQRPAGSLTVMRSPRVSMAKILPFVRRPEALKSRPSSTSGSPSSRTAIEVNSSSLWLASVCVMSRFIQMDRLSDPRRRELDGGRWSAERADEMAGVALRLAGLPASGGSSATAPTRSSSCPASGWRCGSRRRERG